MERPTSAQRRLPHRPNQNKGPSSSRSGTTSKDLWKIAQYEATREKAKDPEERTLLFVGSQQGGKSTLILHFLDREVTTKPTIALEYTFGRKARGHDLVKDVAHLWELGGGTSLSSLVDTPINAATLKSLAVVLVLDLSSPEKIWETAEELLSGVRRRVDKVVDDLNRRDSKLPAYLKKKAIARYGDNSDVWSNMDLPMVQPNLIPILIVGTKYDIFQNFDSEQRKTVSRACRFLAHFHGASILFTSQDENLMARCRAQLANFAFKIPFQVRSAHYDYNKPLLIPAGADSFVGIGAPPQSTSDAGLTARTPMGLWKAAMTDMFPPGSTADIQSRIKNNGDDIDPTKDERYKDDAIDAARVRKLQELERMRRAVERQTNK
eukprot:gene10425-2556_t